MKVLSIIALLLLSTTIIPLHASPPLKPPAAQTVSTKINLNKADLSTLTGSFKGIGKKRAQAIITYRDSHHGFKSIEELADIKGFGQHFMDINREKLNQVFTVN